MKHCGFLLLLITSYGLLEAQVHQGDFVLSTEVSFNEMKIENAIFEGTYTWHSREFIILQSVGYVVSDNLETGFKIGFGHGFAGSEAKKRRSLIGSSYIKKYFPLRKNLYGYAKADYSITSGKTSGYNSSRYRTQHIGLSPGIMYRVSDLFAVEFGLPDLVSYSCWQNFTWEASSSRFFFGLRLNSIDLGFKFSL